MKKILLCLIALSSTLQVQAMTVKDLREPKPFLNKLDINYEPENEFELVKKEQTVQQNTAKLVQDKSDYSRYTYADLSLNKLAAEISQDLAMDTDNISEDVKILWFGAATRSETISYAMFKLANPDSEKPKDSLVKKIIKPVAGLTSVAGVGVPDPFVATSAIVGGNLMKAMTSDNNEFNYKYSKVSDADMVILVRKIDDLQRNLTDRYCDYMAARKILKMSTDITKKRKDRADRMINRTKNEVLIADAYYREALNYENKKRAEFLSKRAALEQLVGNEALRQFEDAIIERENN